MEFSTPFSPINNSSFNEESIKITEEEILNIRLKALDKIKEKYPETNFVVDTRDIDDYSHIIWAYPGILYYTGFEIPKDFENEDELINEIVNDTMEYYDQCQEAVQQFGADI